MELEFITVPKDLPDGVSIRGSGDDDYSVTFLNIKWRLVVNTNASGIQGMYPILGDIAFHYWIEDEDGNTFLKEVRLTTTGKSDPEDSNRDQYEDKKSGHMWSIDDEHDKAGVQYWVEDVDIDLNERTIDIQFTNTAE